ncbi:MAG TPA: VanZ family protein [Oligoflexia bacterium]|nr:VanZ family protein [Oligoflexia bacterium]HMR23724.1 VanZ family protein [Oligoflexia bacterium]
MRKGIKYVVPCGIWVGIIFMFSSQYFSAGNTSTVLYRWIHAFFQSFSREHFWSMHFYIRKFAHVFAYAVLTYFSFVALFKNFYIFKIKPKIRSFICVFIFCLSIAILDEYNQSHIAARTGTYKDILIDMIGVVSVQLFVLIKTSQISMFTSKKK